MHPLLAYPIHLAGLTAAVVILHLMARRNASAQAQITIAAVAGLVLFALLLHVSEPSWKRLFDDFYKAYFAAGQALIKGAPESFAELIFPNRFVNIPILAWVFVPFAALGKIGSGVLFTLVGLIAITVSWRLLVKAAELEKHSAALLLLLFTASGPLVYSVKEGNTTHLVLVLLIAAFLLLRSRRDLAAGLLLGVAAIFKLPLLLFGVYLFLRGRWNAVIGGASVVGGAVLLSLLVHGMDLNAKWLEECVIEFSKHPLASYNTQSVQAFVARLEYGAAFMRDFTPKPLAPSTAPIVSFIVFILYAVSIAAGLRGARRPEFKQNARLSLVAMDLEFMIVLVLALVTSPLAWTHYYTWLLIPAAFVIGGTQHLPRDGITKLLGVGALALMSPPVLVPPYGRVWMEYFVRFPLSTFFVGGMLLLFVLLRARWKLADISSLPLRLPDSCAPSVKYRYL